MRARLAIDASEQPCELREVMLRNKPEAMLRASPKGTVPVVVDSDGTVIDESLDIMLWALRRNDPEQWLEPEAGSLEEVRALIVHFDAHFKDCLDRYKYPDRFPGVDAQLNLAAASSDLQMLEAKLTRTDCLCGARASLADMAITPFVRQFANVNAAWFADQPWPCTQRWLSAIVASPRFERIMRTIPAWTAGTRGVPFPFVS
jgi:glutathione S-transferase